MERFFNEQDRLHMKDVKQIFDWSKRVRFMAGVTASFSFVFLLICFFCEKQVLKNNFVEGLMESVPEHCGADFTGRRCGRICGQPEL